MDNTVRPETTESLVEKSEDRPTVRQGKTAWETPTMEEISDQVMAQPYWGQVEATDSP